MLFDRCMPHVTGTYDEALERYHGTGPEREGWLSNHGPMVVEALARLGHPDLIHPWSDQYLVRLEEVPRGIQPIDGRAWRDPLGDPTRTGDWIRFFLSEADQREWQTLLAQWWPRLLPGIAAGATHGVIRVGHAVRALRAVETDPRRHELAHALAYWAARWQPVPVLATSGTRTVQAVLEVLPPVAHQEFGIRNRLAQLLDTPGWERATRSLAGPQRSSDVPSAIANLVDAVLARYAGWGHGNPTMLVHAATAPMAVANTLPSLPQSMWVPSFEAAWSASAAVLAAYLPRDSRPFRSASDVDEVLEQAMRHGSEHVIKLADTAVRAHERSGDELALAAVLTAVDLDA
jgi:Questin oxidase-like